jgi:hypothetical protein
VRRLNHFHRTRMLAKSSLFWLTYLCCAHAALSQASLPATPAGEVMHCRRAFRNNVGLVALLPDSDDQVADDGYV